MKNNRRRRLFIDRSVQGNLIFRVVLYWIFCMLVVTNMAVCWLVIPQDPSSLSEIVGMTYTILGPILTTSVFVVPLIVIDLVRMSNRFAGPIHRLHREIMRIADGDEATPIQFRKSDCWRDVAEDFNRMLERLQQEPSRAPLQSAEPTPEASQPARSEPQAIAN